MLSNLSQYSPQGLMPQFPGLQAAGFPQMYPGLFGQAGAYNGGVHNTGPFGQELAQAGLSQQFPFGGQINPFLQSPLAQTQFSQGPFALNPYLHSPWLQGPVGHNPLQNSFAHNAGANSPAQHIVPVLGQLAQQIAVQNAVTQQIGTTVQQLAQQLAQQGFGSPGFAGQGLGNHGFGGQGFGVGYGGFGPQPQGWGGNQAWGANRSQTIQ